MSRGWSFVNTHLAAAGDEGAGKHCKGFISRQLTAEEPQSTTRAKATFLITHTNTQALHIQLLLTQGGGK